MLMPIIATKLYVPPPRPNIVQRSRLIERLNQGLHSKVTLISAPAGFGKTTLVSEWVTICGQPVAWLSLDAGENDPRRFLAYLIAALQTVAPQRGDGVLAMLQVPQLPPIEAMLTTLLNELATVPNQFVLVLDDYHLIDATSIDHALTFLIEHLPPQMRLVIATREDPALPLARLRTRGQLNELRAHDLRFTESEAATFLNTAMGLNLSAVDIAVLEARTEGWIAGLQLAALALQGTLSMQGHPDVSGFIQSFTGSHRFVMDYLVEEVLHQQPDHVQTFLLRTSILSRLCDSLCDAVACDASAPGQEILEYLERTNLFIVPLDNERRWYRYHHLFAELLRQRLHRHMAVGAGDVEGGVRDLHIRASQWYEDNGLEIEAFQHAAAANDIERAERLIEGRRIPLHLRGAVTMILDWLGSLPPSVLDARPSLWWRYGALMLVVGLTTGVEEKLDAAEAALQGIVEDNENRHLIGRIATARAVLALTRYQADTMLAQSRRALAYLPSNNLATRANANWTLGYGYLFQGDRAAARQALTEAVSLGQKARDPFTTILATIGLGNVAEAENQLHQAAETYQRVLGLAGSQPLQIIYEAHLGLARILYEWNDLESAQQHGQQSLHLARQYDRVIDRYILCELFLARLKLAQGDGDGAAALLDQASQSARQQKFVHRMAEVAAAQVLMLLHQGNVAAAARLAQQYSLPLSQARVYLAQNNPSAALSVLGPLRQEAEAKDWQDERLRVLVLEALVHQAQGDTEKAVELLGDALRLAAPGGFIRLFVDEGAPMARLLSNVAAQGMMPAYVEKLLTAIEETKEGESSSPSSSVLRPSSLVEPLSQRELDVLHLIAQGLSNQEIGQQLFLALDTVKGHNRRIFAKLHVQRRTEAVARARELGIL